jgi:hypothetical protein
MARSTSLERELLERRVESDPEGYEREAASQVAVAARSLLGGQISVEAVRVSGSRPDSTIEVIFRPQSRKECLLGWRWRIWESKHAPLSIDDVEIEVTTPLLEWLDLEGPQVIANLECGDDEIHWVSELPAG